MRCKKYCKSGYNSGKEERCDTRQVRIEVRRNIMIQVWIKRDKPLAVVPCPFGSDTGG